MRTDILKTILSFEIFGSTAIVAFGFALGRQVSILIISCWAGFEGMFVRI